MIKKILLLLGLLAGNFCLRSQSINLNYSSASIADSLKKDANTVVRLDEALLTIYSPSKYHFKVHEVVTILNAEGAHRLRHRLYFDKFRSFDNVSVKIYNQLGIQTKKYSKKDYNVTAAYDGISLATDDKVMELNMIGPAYPCTVEFEYEQDVNGYIDLPDWYLNTNRTSTEVFKFSVTVPYELDVRYRAVNFDLAPTVQLEHNKKTYNWEARNIKATVYQQHGYAAGYYYPKIEIAPNRFEYDKHAGSFYSWDDFARWNYALYNERNPFSDNRKNEIKSMVAAHATAPEKVKVLYDYLKTNMRYVSLQFGIGGFKPYAVKYVDEKKYGDCKALTNYMRYLLDAVDIVSYPVLINAGHDAVPVDPAFPKTTFNHVILCVPDKADTIWLECTSSDSKAGFLGSFTEDRTALLLKEAGGALVRTPVSNHRSNVLSSFSEIFLDAEGGANTATRFYTTGDIAQEFGQIKKLEPAEMKEALTDYMNYRSAEVFETSGYRDSSDGRVFSVTFKFDKFCAFKAGNKFFYPQKLNKNFYEALKDEKREYAYVFEYPYLKTDTTIIHLPQNFKQDELPVAAAIENALASYKKEVVADPGKVKIITTLILKQRIIAAENYKLLLDFFAGVNGHEEQSVVLKKQ